MPIQPEIKYASVGDLYLDPKNPRLGREHTRQNLSQEQILEFMKDWTLDELAVSFLESGFWIHEALLVVEEHLEGERRLVVVEGNRRLAALKLLFDARSNQSALRKWKEIAASGTTEAFENLIQIPYLVADSREAVAAYLGFRHVTGIKEWNPAEKAEFIAKLIDNGMTYQEVMRKIGSKTETVRRNYISYRVLLQMENLDEKISLDKVEDRFSILLFSLRTRGAQTYLHIDIQADPIHAKEPVPQDKLEDLVKFATWLFGTDKKPPIITDSRQVDQFGKILEAPKAIEYLEKVQRPTLDVAYRIAGGDREETIDAVERAAYDVQQALSIVHHFTEDERLQNAVRRLGKDVLQMLHSFPEIKAELQVGVA